MYNLIDLTTGRHETFELGQNNVKHPTIKIGEIGLEKYNHFTGMRLVEQDGDISLSNKVPVPISFLQYLSREAPDGGKKEYRPYKSLSSDNDSQGKEYPISFKNPRVIDRCSLL